MKYLELDARHPECRGLARALVGSPSIQVSDHMLIKGVDTEPLFGIDYDVFITRDRSGYTWSEQIAIPIDTIKLCPFVAFREGVSVACKSVPSLAKGVIESISTNRGFTDIVIGDYGAFDIREITLDLERLPNGARIVEVSE